MISGSSKVRCVEATSPYGAILLRDDCRQWSRSIDIRRIRETANRLQQQTPEPQPQLDDVTSSGRGRAGIAGSASEAVPTSGLIALMIAA